MPEPPYFIVFEFGVSSKLADWDNPVKPLQDIIQKKYGKKYGFDDRDIIIGTAYKKITEKNQEYLKFIIGNHRDYVKYLCDTYNLKEMD